MKLLIDENISYRLVKKIEDIFPNSQQVKRLGLLAKEDEIIWKFAVNFGYTILTFDEDYKELSNLLGTPPKVILLKTFENASTFKIEEVLRKYYLEIEHFHSKEFF